MTQAWAGGSQCCVACPFSDSSTGTSSAPSSPLPPSHTLLQAQRCRTQHRSERWAQHPLEGAAGGTLPIPAGSRNPGKHPAGSGAAGRDPAPPPPPCPSQPLPRGTPGQCPPPGSAGPPPLLPLSLPGTPRPGDTPSEPTQPPPGTPPAAEQRHLAAGPGLAGSLRGGPGTGPPSPQLPVPAPAAWKGATGGTGQFGGSPQPAPRPFSPLPRGPAPR